MIVIVIVIVETLLPIAADTFPPYGDSLLFHYMAIRPRPPSNLTGARPSSGEGQVLHTGYFGICGCGLTGVALPGADGGPLRPDCPGGVAAQTMIM
jgi:hypothetical protein